MGGTTAKHFPAWKTARVRVNQQSAGNERSIPVLTAPWKIPPPFNPQITDIQVRAKGLMAPGFFSSFLGWRGRDFDVQLLVFIQHFDIFVQNPRNHNVPHQDNADQVPSTGKVIKRAEGWMGWDLLTRQKITAKVSQRRLQTRQPARTCRRGGAGCVFIFYK